MNVTSFKLVDIAASLRGHTLVVEVNLLFLDSPCVVGFLVSSVLEPDGENSTGQDFSLALSLYIVSRVYFCV